MEVLINNLQDKVELTKELENLLEKVTNKALNEKNVRQEGEVSFALVDNDYIQQLNKQYRSKDKPTDVLSFPMDSLASGEAYVVLGDIIISLEKAVEQAADYGHSLDRELAFLTVHGVLHLLGYDHEDEQEREEMEKEQENILVAMGIGRE